MLLDAHAMNIEFPQSFILPTTEQLTGIAPGSFLKVSANNERFWVCVSVVEGDMISARIDNHLLHPINCARWKCGDSVSLHQRNVLDVQRPEMKDAFVAALTLTHAANCGKDIVLQAPHASNRPRTVDELFLTYLIHSIRLREEPQDAVVRSDSDASAP